MNGALPMAIHRAGESLALKKFKKKGQPLTLTLDLHMNLPHFLMLSESANNVVWQF